ncbi:pyridoxal-phosphate dependent enzyme [Fluviispira multicolorata]|uniref:Pyridoxal-phosphate dependent enzyme n=1 Tax=Fluviispira multicolorata TaxID=2654512 RepID=A0A833JFM0_9BACT|nr:pyridoxal-phosphate dependent enzyme [Fluviispira multicolorata]KAB8033765.1 pyridoxal-phosphate dependent enzyme [Fluviispira multicolorata]
MNPELLKRLNFVEGKKFENPSEVIEEIRDAHKNIICKYMQPSPLRKSDWLSEITGGEVWLKLESLNPNGSFKVRGALNAVSNIIKNNQSNNSKIINVCAASAGNHAQGVAFAAKNLGCEAHIFLPKFAPLVKRDATEKLGAKIYLIGNNLEEAFEAALAFSEKENAHFIHAFNNYDIIIGQATCAYEALLQLSDLSKTPFGELDFFTCSVGGGGLAAGAALVLKALTSANIVGIEQEYYDSAIKSFKYKSQTASSIAPHATIADGIAVGMIGNLNYNYMTRFVENLSTVSDDSIVKAILGLCEQERILSEGAGAAAVADILKRPDFYKGKRVIACVSGGNIDPQLLTRVVTRGLNITGRVLRVSVCVSDRPGGLKRLLECVSALEGNVLDLIHDRTYSEVSVGDVDVELSLETRNSEHQYSLLEKLEEAGFKPRMRN